MSAARFAGKTAVITGGASGIGKACAIAFARDGASVVIADVNAPRLAEAKAEVAAMGGEVLAKTCDVSRDEDVEALAAAAFARFGEVDILMNNAGVMLRGPLEKMPISDWEWIFGINLFGAVRGLRVFLPPMMERGSGYIVNTASIGGLIGGRPHSASYSASKFALVGLSETLYAHLKPKGIGVSVLCPGGVKTKLIEQLKLSKAAQGTDELGLDEVFGADAADPDDVAALVLDSIVAGKFMILTDPRHEKLLALKASDMQAYVDARAKMTKATPARGSGLQKSPSHENPRNTDDGPIASGTR